MKLQIQIWHVGVASAIALWPELETEEVGQGQKVAY